MKSIRTFIAEFGLQPGDAIKAKKIGWEILDHYAVYVGQDVSGTHYFMANSMNEGVRYYSENEVPQLLRDFSPRQIRRFNGNKYQRDLAVQRAVSQEGAEYSLLGYNCEHFANYVQYGRKFSKQVGNFSTALLAMLFVAGISKSK